MLGLLVCLLFVGSVGFVLLYHFVGVTKTEVINIYFIITKFNMHHFNVEHNLFFFSELSRRQLKSNPMQLSLI